MRVLLDTHTLLWAVAEPRRLSPAVREIFIDTTNDLVVSAVTAFELSTKHALGKLPQAGPLVLSFHAALRRLNATELALTSNHSLLAGSLPGPHHDPFDRLLAAQSLLEGLPLVSVDPAFDNLGIRRLW